jgi:hypothetical protein
VVEIVKVHQVVELQHKVHQGVIQDLEMQVAQEHHQHQDQEVALVAEVRNPVGTLERLGQAQYMAELVAVAAVE